MNKYYECEICGKLYKTEEEVIKCETECKAKKQKQDDFLKNKEKAIEEIKTTKQHLRELEEKFSKEFNPNSIWSYGNKYYADGTEIPKSLFDIYKLWFY